MSLLHRKPQYTLSEINEYIANYEKLLNETNTVVGHATMFHCMREVIQRMNEYLLAETKGK